MLGLLHGLHLRNGRTRHLTVAGFHLTHLHMVASAVVELSVEVLMPSYRLSARRLLWIVVVRCWDMDETGKEGTGLGWVGERSDLLEMGCTGLDG